MNDLHQIVWQGHHGDDEDIHRETKPHDPDVEGDQPMIVRQALRYEVILDCPEEVPVQACVDEKEGTLLKSIPMI